MDSDNFDLIERKVASSRETKVTSFPQQHSVLNRSMSYSTFAKSSWRQATWGLLGGWAELRLSPVTSTFPAVPAAPGPHTEERRGSSLRNRARWEAQCRTNAVWRQGKLGKKETGFLFLVCTVKMFL